MPVGPSTLSRGSAGLGGTDRPALSGRVTALEAGPANASGLRRVYAGTAGGGVWRSDDSGLTWAPLLDDVSSDVTGPGGNVMSTGALAVHFGATAADDVIYVGTGESNLGSPTTITSDEVPGAGILRSGPPTGGGWRLEATNYLAGERVAGLLLDPADPDHVLAASTAGAFHRQGGSWSPVAGLPSGYASGVAMSMAGGTPTYYVAIVDGGVYSSANLDSGWTLLSGIPPAPGRLVVGACDSDPSGVYALREDGTLWKLAGTAFQQVGGVPDAFLPGNPLNDGSNYYHLVVTVHPSDPRTVYLGHERLYLATVTGSPPAVTPSPPPYFQYLLADVHAVAFARLPNGARDPTELWIGDDGGVYRSKAPTNAFSVERLMIGRATNQPYALALRTDTDAVALIGMQDTGIGRWLGEPAWVRPAIYGDCFAVAIDPAKPWRMMAALNSYAAGISQLYTSNDSGLSFSPVNTFPVSEPSGQPVGALDAVASAGGSLLFFGTTRLWVSEDWGSTWNSIPGGTGSDTIDDTAIVALSVVSDLVVYAATRYHIRRYERVEPGAPWTTTNIENPPGTDVNYWISGLAASPSDAFFLTYSRRPPNSTIGWAHFNNGIGTSAASWQEALPLSVVDRPAHAVVADPSNHSIGYVGTDAGVWKITYDPGGIAAEPFSFGLPETAVFDLAFHPRSRVLYAATHGRGVWEVDPDDLENATDPNLYLRLNYADNGRLAGPRKRQPYLDDGLPDPSLPAGTPGALYSWMSPDIKIRRPSHDPAPLDLIDYVDFTTRVDDVVDAVLDSETADIGPNSVYVQVHNRSMTPLPPDQVHVLTLVTDASLALPPLPSDWANRINALDTGNWLGPDWHYADPGRPYHLPVQSASGPSQGPLDARTPVIYEFDVDFSQLNLPAGHDHACVAAFVTAPGASPFGAIPTDFPPDLRYVAHSDTHVAFRNVHLVALHLADRRPSGASDTSGSGRMVHVYARNPYDRPIETDLVIRGAAVTAPLAVILPHLELEQRALEGLRAAGPDELDEALRYAHRSWFARLEELDSMVQLERTKRLRRLDPQRLLRSVGPGDTAVRRIPLEPGDTMPVGLLLRAPDYAQPGEKYRMHVMQTHDGQILGGSTYVLATYV